MSCSWIVSRRGGSQIGQGLGTRNEPHKHAGIVGGKGAAVWVIGEEGGGCVGKGPS